MTNNLFVTGKNSSMTHLVDSSRKIKCDAPTVTISNSSLIHHKTLSVTKTVLSLTKTVCHRKEVLY